MRSSIHFHRTPWALFFGGHSSIHCLEPSRRFLTFSNKFRRGRRNILETEAQTDSRESELPPTSQYRSTSRPRLSGDASLHTLNQRHHRLTTKTWNENDGIGARRDFVMQDSFPLPPPPPINRGRSQNTATAAAPGWASAGTSSSSFSASATAPTTPTHTHSRNPQRKDFGRHAPAGRNPHSRATQQQNVSQSHVAGKPRRSRHHEDEDEDAVVGEDDDDDEQPPDFLDILRSPYYSELTEKNLPELLKLPFSLIRPKPAGSHFSVPAVVVEPGYHQLLAEFFASTLNISFTRIPTMVQAVTHESYPRLASSAAEGATATATATAAAVKQSYQPYCGVGSVVLRLVLTSWLLQVCPTLLPSQQERLLSHWVHPSTLLQVGAKLRLTSVMLASTKYLPEESAYEQYVLRDVREVGLRGSSSPRVGVGRRRGTWRPAVPQQRRDRRDPVRVDHEVVVAVVGAYYMDSGLVPARRLVYNHLLPNLLAFTSAQVLDEVNLLRQPSGGGGGGGSGSDESPDDTH